MSVPSPLHPSTVHFPIALLATGSVIALVYLLGWRRPALPVVAWAVIFLGWLAVFAAILSGFIDRERAPGDPAVLALLNPHIAAGFGLLIVYGLLLYERLRNPAVLDAPQRRWYLLALLGVGHLVGIAAGIAMLSGIIIAWGIATSALGGETLRYWGTGPDPATGTIEIGKGRYERVTVGTEIPGWGRVTALTDSHLVVERVLSDLDKQELADKGAMVYDRIEMRFSREDLLYGRPLPWPQPSR